MIDALYVAATGMHTQESQINTISNNLTNLNTVGYKKSRVTFSDLFYRDRLNQTNQIPGQANVGSERIGMGSTIARINKVFADGDIKITDNPLDLAIRGKGFFEVELDNGELAYTRNGAFKVREDGLIATLDNHPLTANIRIPPDARNVQINNQGLVVALLGNDNLPTELGQLELSTFFNDAALNPIGENLYLANNESGNPAYGFPGELTTGEIRQGGLESSNVDLVEELIDLTIAQRAYEVNSQIVRASDEILRINNNLRQ